MSIENLPLSARGDLRIRNLTHYNTEDIVALVNLVEKHRPPNEYMWGGNVERAVVPDTQKVLELREFTGAPRHESTYVNGTTVPGRRKLLAPIRWRQPLILRLLPPDKLFVSPLQTLSEEALSDTRTLPREMVSELVEAVAQLYRRRSYSRDVEAIPLKGLSIRIDKKKPKGSKKHADLARKRSLLHDAHRSLSYRAKQASRAIEIMQEEARRMKLFASSMGMDSQDLNGLILDVNTAFDIVKPMHGRTEQLARRAQELVDAC